MKILITGICGFVGGSIARWLREHHESFEIVGLDNLSRRGSESSPVSLRGLGVHFLHGDIRNASDFESLGAVDWVIDAAAKPSVRAGLDGITNSRQLMEHNLQGTLNILEYCKRVRAGFILLSTSRVYNVNELASLPMEVRDHAFRLDDSRPLPLGVTKSGIREDFSTGAPISLYGSTKLASEILALEYADAFDFPVWINRCGVLSGAGQFGTAEQGIFSFWLHAYAHKHPLRYIGFGGTGHQVRDAFHPEDLARLIVAQMGKGEYKGLRIFNVGGGPENAMSLAQLTAWCAEQFGQNAVAIDLTPRPYDVAWLVMDYTKALQTFGWRPERGLNSILVDLALHARRNPHWLEITGGI